MARSFDTSAINRDEHYDAQPGDIVYGMGGRGHMVSSVEEYEHPWTDIPYFARIIKCEDGYGITAFGPRKPDTEGMAYWETSAA